MRRFGLRAALEGQGSYVAGASAATRKKANLLADAFEIDVDDIEKAKPNDYFNAVLEAVGDQHRVELEELITKAFRLGVRRGAIVATDAIVSGKISVEQSDEGNVLTANEPQLNLPSRKLTFGSVKVDVDKFTLPVDKIGFE